MIRKVDARALVADVLAGLPAELGELVRDRVRIELRARPDREDLERGAGATWRGYFYGQQLEQLAHVTEWEAAGELLAPVRKGGGVVRIFLANLRGPDELVEVLLHELHHFVGADEDDVAAEGLGEFEAELELEEACA